MLDYYIKDLPKKLRLDLNSIISTYLDHLRYIERKNVYDYIQEFREIILPNIEKWYKDYGYGNWNWEFFVWFMDINNERNKISHLFYEKDNYKQILIDFKHKFNDEDLIKTIPKFNKFKSYIIEFIDSETQTE
jgi:hypothetical protein